MIRARILIVAAVACAFAAAPAGAGIERAGTTAANFLAIGSDPGVLAMGGAVLGLEGGLAAFEWNPATLARLGRSEAVFSHAALGEQNAQEWAGFGGRVRFAGLSGAITGRFQHEGSFEGRDALNNPTGSFDVSSLALGAGVARAFGPFVTAGLGLKYASENLGGVRGSGVALDAGLQVRSGSFGFGAAAQNAFGRMKYGAASYDFPAGYGFGVSYDHASSGVRVALDMNFPAAYYSDIRGGLEWRWNERFALRTGYRAELGAASGEPLGGPTFGMGAGAGGMWFDYGYLVGGGGAGQHRIGITFHPGAFSLSPDGGRELGHASTDVPPATDTKASAPARPRASPPESVPATSSTTAPASAPAGSGTRAPATSSTPAGTSAAPPASAPASTRSPVTAPVQSGAAARPPAGVPAATPATSSASATAAGSGANATPPASASASSSPRASAPASAGATATGPVAAQVGSAPAPPSYAQRAKAARGTGETSASDRKTAALAPTATASARPPVAPQGSATPPAAARRDSTAAPKSSPNAPAGSATAASGAPARPDSAAARGNAAGGSATVAPPAPSTGPRPDKVRVKNRQTMEDIARAYGTSVAAIMMENNLVTDRVRPGQVLKLPRR